ncbi:hypothetical protein F5141DRAFT_1089348 [Pisolithus sp. B1]|nr:hypothetical protein F5141DRAFT_1089348 [Pisolithus sp. B1]
MPATRASSTGVSSSSMQQKRYRTPIRPPGGSAKSMKTSPHPEVIILSSEDENSPIVSAGRTKKPSRHLKKSKAVLRLPTQALGEVLEISDSDEVQPSPPAAKWKTEVSTTQNLQRAVNSLEQALRFSNERAAQELSELKSLEKAQAEEINALRSALSKDFSELEDHTLCEVCTHKMWKPYLLPDCGHCFCQDCLVGWFTTTQVKFMNSHPDYDPQHAMAHGQLHVLLKSIPAILNPNVRQQLKALLVKLRKMRPEYTCPSCRKTAVTKPVEDFRLKALVRHISDLQGEACPQESSPSHPVASTGPFDVFFPDPWV